MASITREQLFAPKEINNAAPDTLFTVAPTPTNLLLINGRVRFSNHTGSAATITAWAIPSGDSAANDNIALPETSIGTTSYIDIDVPQLSAGGFFQAQADTGSAITAQPLNGAYYAP